MGVEHQQSDRAPHDPSHTPFASDISAPILAQEAANAPALQTRNTIYSNLAGTCAVICPPEFSAHIVAQLTDAHLHALVPSNGIAMVSVYLPDSWKSDHVYEMALDSVSATLDVLRARYRVRGMVIAGDMNVEFSPVPGSLVLGTCLWPALGQRFKERQDMLMHFCSRHGLVHGPSHIQGDALERWTREAWGPRAARSSLDHLLLSQTLCLVRWSPWPALDFCRRKRRLWGDHRPILAALALAQAHGTQHLELHTPCAQRSFKGWEPSTEMDVSRVHVLLEQWVQRNAALLLARSPAEWAPVARAVSMAIVDSCTSVSHTTAAQRRSGAVPPPPELRDTRQAFRQLDPADHAAKLANRRQQRKLVRRWHTQRFMSSGGLRMARYRDGWKSLSFVQLHANAAPTCDRSLWRQELLRHWAERFADHMDSDSSQAKFCARLFSKADGRAAFVSIGDVVVSLSAGGRGSAGGPDGPVNEMLHCLPWPFVSFLRDVFNRRFQADLEAFLHKDDWRMFTATWIRKDSDSDLLSSFRPIMQSSVMLKCVERLLVGPAPMQLILHRAPLWGFRPRMSSSMLCNATSAAVKSLLQFHAIDTPAQGNVDGVFLTVDVEKAFDKTTMSAQARALDSIGFRPECLATLAAELLASGVHVRLGDVEVGPLPHSRGKQGGCSTPFVFSAVIAVLMEPLVREWRRRGWGIPLAGQDCCLCCAVFADNILLCGSSAQVVAMYAELTKALHRSELRWKPNSFHALGLAGCVLALPAVGAQPRRDITCSTRVPWLGQVLSYDPGWDAEYDASFSAATLAWNLNRKWLYNRRLTLRVRIRIFSQSVVSVLVSRLCQLPCSTTVLQRARRWENRCLRALTGMNHAFLVVGEFGAWTRKARKVAAKVGHIDVVAQCLRRHYRIAGQWARLPADSGDMAM